MSLISTTKAIALQRCDRFVARTMNWLYDHLRCVPDYIPIVLCDELLNRDEFPALEAHCINRERFTRRVWRRFMGDHLYPSDWWKLRRLAPRILHSHFGYIAVQDHELRRALDVPWIVGFYGADVYAAGRRVEWQQMYAQVFDEAERVLALGPVMQTHLERLGCPAEKVDIHPLGVDIETLPTRPRLLKPGEPLRVLFAGTYREKKGISYLIEAAALALRAGLRLKLHLVADVMGKPGDCETREAVFRQIRSRGLEDVVTVHAFLKFRELVELALDSHVFVAPSVTAADGDAEGTPFVLQQMMATGMPAVATIHSDIPYVFGAHKHLLVPERNARAIADHLQRYVDDPDALVTDGMALRDQIRSAFDLRKCAARLRDLYNAVQ